MNTKFIKNELQHILQGTGEVSHGKLIQTIASYLRGSQKTSNLAQEHKHIKNKEADLIVEYCKSNNLLIDDIDINLFVSEGAEQKVFINDNYSVFKLNDAIYYLTWLDYFDNLLLNNYFFSDTFYHLKGFYLDQKTQSLYAFVEQKYIRATEKTDLEIVKKFLSSNGFTNTKNNDYFHPELGIILEDLHDENVLTANGILYFIDTVFYIKPEIFWK